MIDIAKLEAAMRELTSEYSHGKFLTQRSAFNGVLGTFNPLSNVFSREFFKIQLETQMSIAKSHNSLLVIFAVGINNLSKQNNTCSGDAINSAARKVAKCLSTLFRRRTDLIARIESNQFMVLTLSMSEDQAKVYLPAVRNRLNELTLDSELSTKIIMHPYMASHTYGSSAADLIDMVQHELHSA